MTPLMASGNQPTKKSRRYVFFVKHWPVNVEPNITIVADGFRGCSGLYQTSDLVDGRSTHPALAMRLLGNSREIPYHNGLA